uniref:Proprotein convertase subtilisin/kexin type 5-like n=1 Tax=Neolamprologus brichardi TaxID=32507 RepID=A0A3Q4GEQ2_NEOBR
MNTKCSMAEGNSCSLFRNDQLLCSMARFIALWVGTLLQLCHATIYTNDWAIKIRGDLESVNRIAEKYGFTNMGQVSALKHEEGNYLHNYQTCIWKLDINICTNVPFKVEWLKQQVVQRRVKRISRLFPATDSKACQSHMNIAAAWRRGYTGKGVVVSVLDDGIEREHPDLKPNYDPFASFDVNGQDQDRSSNSAVNNHGTQCAGVVAAAANSSRCTVGVSFHARIGGIRMLDGDVTDIVEAQSLSFSPGYIDVYLAGWGPKDDGATLDGPGPLTRLVLQNGVQTGRQGRGSIFLWPSGNGGERGDYCSCDGYSNSIYTISISSSTQRGSQPDYLEPCPSTLATPLRENMSYDSMVTVGPQQSCSTAQSGTSLAASVAAGVIALTLEANPLLTWRDLQHIIVRTSKAHHLSAPDWRVNGAGYKVSHLYGFGLLDAESMVKEAERWKQVPSQHECAEEAAIQLIHPGSVLMSVHETTGCSGEAPQHVAYVEHVVVRVNISHGRRGDLSITLTSPLGTTSQLLANRPLDNSTEGFQNWEFMTAHCWGEQAAGEWTLKIQDTPSQKKDGVLEKWSLVIYGTAERPYPAHRERARSAEIPTDSDLSEEYSGPCDPECSDDGCEGPGPQQCVTCLHFFLKFKNNTRLCVSGCPRGFWGDRRRCKRCYASCESCTGSRSDQCTSCQPGHHLTEGTNTCTAICGENYYLDHGWFCFVKFFVIKLILQGNRCQRSCAPGFYHDPQEAACKPCHQACATCAGAGVEACNTCAEGYLMEEWRCVSSCSAGFYDFCVKGSLFTLCAPLFRCDASCLTCVGPSRWNCSSCSSGHILQRGSCAADTECTDGEYQDSNGECHACHATCLKCRGPQSEDCISCISSQALDEGRCVVGCASGKYQSGGRCHLCDHTCATCVDAGPANCTSCDTDKFKVERYLYKGMCLDVCPEAFYHTKQRTCEPCVDHCRLCTGPNHCLKCNSSYYVSDGSCVKLECGEGEVEDPDYDDCMACEQGCKKCVLYNPRHCLSCIEGFYNFQDGCYKNCPAKTYSVEEEMTCVPCDDNCVSCDEHECYWCEKATFFLSSEGKCISECPDGFYGDEDSNNCEECHSDCVTCSGPEDEDCLLCEEGKALENGECVSDHEVCPIKTFLSDGECEDCHPSCESCAGPEKNQCTKCAKGLSLQTCVLKCPGGFIASQLSGVCEACPAGCLQCVDVQHCIRCQSARKAQLFLQDGQCVQECVRGFPAGQVCHSCAPGCASCARNATHCLSCEEPLLLHKHQCVDKCPPAHTVQERECQPCPSGCQDHKPRTKSGLCVLDCPERFFEDKEQGRCLQCHLDCALCDGPNSNDCDACTDAEATLHNGACLGACPSHTYMDGITGDCKDCNTSCLTCFGPHASSCTSCREGQMLDGNSQCVPSASKCSPHQYIDQHGDCHPCHKYCYRCSGPGKTHCLSCNPRHLLLNGTCVDQCPTGYYEQESGQKCEPCHASCKSCVGKHNHECLTCKDHLFREGKECVETCQHRYHYGNTASRMCEKCDPSCGECIGDEENGCLSCAPGLIYLRKQGRCLASCPQGYYHDTVHRTCEHCHASCRTCSGKLPESCDSCYPGYLLSYGRCESICDKGQHPIIKGSSHSCEDCDSSCLECRGPGPSNCTVCSAQAILEAGGRCLLCCHHEDEDTKTQQQDCCNCTETRGECILSTNLAFRNEEEEEARGNLTVFIIACVLLVLVLVTVVILIRHSRLKNESQLVDLSERRSGNKDDDNDDDDDEDEDIVYMGQDGTVYRKFRYGQLGEDNEDELEYDDESYTFR